MTPRRFMPALLLLFVGSGCAALIYEIVWFQLLQLVIGSSAVSLGVLLGTFMGGMCLGSLLLPRYVSERHHPLRVYAWLEIGIGVIGVLVLFGMPLVSGVYTAWAGTGTFSLILRGLAAAICLLPPTMLMGATLPAIARWVRTHAGRRLVARLLLRRQHRRRGDRQPARRLLPAARARHRVRDLRRGRRSTSWSPASRCWWRAPAPYEAQAHESHRRARSPGRPARGRSTWRSALSGLTALSAEVIWTRMLSLLFGATVYTFSLILAVFLFGLGIGSSVGSALARTPGAPARRARLVPDGAVRGDRLGRLHVHAVAALLAGQPVARDQPVVQLPARSGADPVGGAAGGDPLGRQLPAGARLGRHRRDRIPGGWSAASMPPTPSARSSARSTSSLLLVTWLGSQRAQQLLIIIAGLSALLVLEAAPAADTGRRRSAFAGTIPIIVAAVCAALLARNVPAIPPMLVAYGRYAVTRIGQADVIYSGEGWNASVAGHASARRHPATITTPARSRPRASRRTCACSGCSGT